jgi:hypothetical protein
VGSDGGYKRVVVPSALGTVRVGTVWIRRGTVQNMTWQACFGRMNNTVPRVAHPFALSCRGIPDRMSPDQLRLYPHSLSRSTTSTWSDAYSSMSCHSGSTSFTLVSHARSSPLGRRVWFSISRPTESAVKSFELEAMAKRDWRSAGGTTLKEHSERGQVRPRVGPSEVG